MERIPFLPPAGLSSRERAQGEGPTSSGLSDAGLCSPSPHLHPRQLSLRVPEISQRRGWRATVAPSSSPCVLPMRAWASDPPGGARLVIDTESKFLSGAKATPEPRDQLSWACQGPWGWPGPGSWRGARGSPSGTHGLGGWRRCQGSGCAPVASCLSPGRCPRAALQRPVVL